MRIWIVNHYALPPHASGGTRHFGFAHELIQRGHEVTLIASDYDHNSHTFFPRSVGKIDRTCAVPFVWIPTPAYKGNTIARLWNMLVYSFRILQKKYLMNAEQKPDVIIGSSPHLFAAFAAKRLAKRLKIPFILEVRDLWPETLIDLGKMSSYHPLIMVMKWIERHLYHHADRIISLLPHATEYFMQYGVSASRVTWLPNAIHADALALTYTQQKQDKFTIMYAGAHGLANDLETVLDAAKILQYQGLDQNIRICLLGNGPHKDFLKNRAENEKINMVDFIDAVPKSKIYAMLNKADGFLMLLKKSPLFRYGISPNKLFDYLVMARPIIFGVDTAYNPIQECQAGITIAPSDPKALAKAIQNLYQLPESERVAMGLRGKNFVMENHYIKNLTNILEKILLEI